MATFTKVNTFALALGTEKHQLATDQLVVALCAAANAPTTSSAVLADLTQISYTNFSTRNITTTSFTQSGGVATLALVDLTLTASGATAAFRYVVVYNSSAPSSEIIGYIDYGSDRSLATSETFLIDFAASSITIT